MVDIVEGCKQHNTIAQSLLYEKYFKKMRQLCKRYITNKDDLNDVMQEGFVKVFYKIPQYSFRGSIEGWMRRVFISCAIDFINAKNKIRVESKPIIIDSDYPLMDNFSFEIQDSHPNYFSELDIQKALEQIPYEYSQPIKLFYLENLSHSDISVKLEITNVTSRIRLLRAKEYLRRYLNKTELAENY